MEIYNSTIVLTIDIIIMNTNGTRDRKNNSPVKQQFNFNIIVRARGTYSLHFWIKLAVPRPPGISTSSVEDTAEN